MSSAPITKIEEVETGTDSELPEGWAESHLAELAKAIQYGYTASAQSGAAGPRFLRITDIQENSVNWKTVPTCEISKSDLQKYRLSPGDILFARTGATTGKSFLIQSCPFAVFASYLIRVQPVPDIDANFLWLSFQTHHYWEFISDNVAGNAQPNCNASKLAELPLYLAPSSEQKRIVKRAGELQQQIVAAKAKLNRTKALLKHFRQAVLAAACSGKLTEDWHEAQHRDAELPSGWQWLELREILPKGGIFDGPFGSNLKTADYTAGGVRVVRLENIGRLVFVDSKRAYISEEKYRSLEKHTVKQGDIIFSSFVDDEIRTCVLPSLPTKAIAKADCFCLRPIPDKVDARYLTLQLASRETYDPLIEDIHGATRPRVNTTQLKRLKVRMCSLAEQEEIVRRVEALFKLADAIEKRVAAASVRAEKLTQAILAKAFRGKLVPTEAELARREGREYEPASVLLERIKKERAAAEMGKGKRGKKTAQVQ